MKIVLVLLASLQLIWALPEGRINPRLVGGNVARAGQFPWQVAVYVDNNKGATLFCGGVLVKKNWILTAGHCVNGAKVFTLRLGSNSLLKLEPTRIVVGASFSIVHPNFNESSVESNVGLIRIDVPYKENERIQTISLASIPSAPIAGSAVTISGWGSTGNWDGVTPDLNYLEVQVSSKAECESSNGKLVTNSVFCVSGKNQQGTCAGDIGSGIIARDAAHNPILVGLVVSGSAKGCDTSIPSAAHVRIAPYRDWILRQING